MFRRVLPILSCFCLLLCGCVREQKPMQEALSFRQRLLSSDGCTFTADVTADYGDSFYTFKMECSFQDGTGKMTVLEPDSISGIRAVCNGDASDIVFEDTILDFGKLHNGAVAPLCVPWLFPDSWKQDEITAASSDEEHVRVTIQKGYDEKRLLLDTWLSEGVPILGEVAGEDGRRMLTVAFHDFRFSDDQP